MGALLLVMLFLDVAFKLQLADAQDPLHYKGKSFLLYYSSCVKIDLKSPSDYSSLLLKKVLLKQKFENVQEIDLTTNTALEKKSAKHNIIRNTNFDIDCFSLNFVLDPEFISPVFSENQKYFIHECRF